ARLPNGPCGPGPVVTVLPFQLVTEGDFVSLTSEAHNAPSAVYTWEQVSGPTAVLNDPANPAPTFIAPDVDATTDLVFVLNVEDNGVHAPAAVAVVRVMRFNPNDATADAGPDQTVQENALVMLDATGSFDADGD